MFFLPFSIALIYPLSIYFPLHGGREGFGHEYFSYRRKKNFSTPTRGFAYSRNIAPSFSSLSEAKPFASSSPPFTLFTAEHIGRSSNVFRRESRIMEASPATATRQSGIATSQKNCLCISDLRAVFSLKNGKENFSLDTLLWQAERRERLLLVRRKDGNK